MNYLSVMLWGEELGRLVWNQAKRTTYFEFNPHVTNRPDVSPLLCPAESRCGILPVYGDSRPIYQGLPPFIADSLPDAWGNKLFDQWVKSNRIPRTSITPLYKLMFIGKRGMGALEFKPAAGELEYGRQVDLRSLYDLSVDVLLNREKAEISQPDTLTMQALLAVGTSAGGRQMKAVVAIDPASGLIRSGQCEAPDGFEFCIVKFEDSAVPTAEIEMACYEMATSCGIDMEHCQLIVADGVNHFLTRRFDRRNGRKIHMQTLAAINPDAQSYEDVMDTCRRLGLFEVELEQIYRRLVFNVLANNTDDHNRNISFLLEKDGRWRLSPAYDMTFIFNTYGTGPQLDRCMSLGGKTCDITLNDLLEFARDNSIANAHSIIVEVAQSLMQFPQLVDKYHIPNPWAHIAVKCINERLADFGFIHLEALLSEFMDNDGHKFSNISLSVNTKGYYELSATVDGRRRRRFIKQDSDLYMSLCDMDAHRLSRNETMALISAAFA